MANEEKELGNTAFQNKNYPDALRHYSAAIAQDPHNVVYYSNRAATYIGLEKYQEALDDANKCIGIDPSFSKAYTRKGDALLKLKNYEEAKCAYEECLKLEPENTFAKHGKSKCILLLKHQELNAYYISYTKELPVKVQFINEILGKGLFANRDIKQGEIIFREKPLVCQQWTSSKKQALCCKCCMQFLGPSLIVQVALLIGPNFINSEMLPFEKKCGTSLPIPVKNGILLYCSEKCKQKSDLIHSILYPGTPPSTIWMEHALSNQLDRFLLAGEVVTSLIVDIAIKGKSKEEAWFPYKHFTRGSWISIISNQCSDLVQKEEITRDLRATLRTSNHLLIQSLKEKIKQLENPDAPWKEFLTDVFLDSVLGMFELNNASIEIESPLHTYFGQVHSEKILHKQSAPILGPIVTEINKKHNCIPSCLGHGLFTVHSCMNHSCNPNVKQTSLETIKLAEIAIEAVRDIKKGEQICLSYVEKEKSQIEKREILKRDYLFDCQCDSCKKQVTQNL